MASTAGAAALESALPEHSRRRLLLLPVRPRQSCSLPKSAPRRLKKATSARLRSAPEIGCGTLDALADFFLISSPRRPREGCPALPSSGRRVATAADQWRVSGSFERSTGLIDGVGTGTGPRGRSTTTAGATASLTDEEFHQLIYDKLRTTSHGLKNLFKAHDPTGNGAVSAAAFKKILFALCGYVCPAQCDRLLRRMNAEGSRPITFEVLASCFDGCRIREKDGNKEWLTWQGPLATSDGGQRRPHFALGDAELHKRIPETQHSTPQRQETTRKLKRASYVLTIMKKFIRERKPEAVKILNSVLDDKRPILQHHLKDFTEKVLAMPMNAKELQKLWTRFDQSGTGAITATQLLSRLGMKSCSRFKTSVSEYITDNDKGAKAGSDKRAEANMDAHQDLTKTTLDRFGLKSTAKEQRQSLVDSASSSLINTAGDVLQSLDARLREFMEILLNEDSMKTNIIALTAIQQKLGELILREIGDHSIRQIIINAGAMTSNENVDYFRLLEHLHGMRCIFCRENTIPQSFNKDGCLKEVALTLHTSNVELRLLRYFHGSFIDLVDRLRKADKTSTGLLPSSIVKNILEVVTGVCIAESSWNEFHFALTEQMTNNPSDASLMDYSMLLQALASCDSTCWTKESSGFRKSRPSHIKIKVPVLPASRKGTHCSSSSVLQNYRLPLMPRQLPLERPPRSVEELSTVVKNLVSTQFYVLDQAYRGEDRKYTGRIGIETMHRILKAAQEELTWPEMTALWSSLDRAPDGMYTWSRFCHKFMDKDAKVRALAKPAQAAASGDAHAAIGKGDIGEHNRATSGPSTGSLTVLLDRLSPSVVESMKRSLENADHTHSGFVSTADAKRTFVELHLPASDVERDQLFRKFATTQPGGFAYKRFLDAYATHVASNNKDLTKANNCTSQGNVRMSAAVRSSLASRLAGQQKLFKRACKALDRQGSGHLSIADLRAAMDQVNIRLSEEDIFVLFNEHDKKLTGRIDYKSLISSLLGSLQ